MPFSIRLLRPAFSLSYVALVRNTVMVFGLPQPKVTRSFKRKSLRSFVNAFTLSAVAEIDISTSKPPRIPMHIHERIGLHITHTGVDGDADVVHVVMMPVGSTTTG